jgi:hypothetical protein
LFNNNQEADVTAKKVTLENIKTCVATMGEKPNG